MTDSRQMHVNKSSFNERHLALLGCIKNIATVSVQLQQQEAELPKRQYPESDQCIIIKQTLSKKDGVSHKPYWIKQAC